MQRSFNRRGLRVYVMAAAITGLVGLNSGWSEIASAKTNAPSGAEIALKNVKDVVHRLRAASLDLINDVEQRSMVVTGSPDIIEPIAYKDKNSISWSREMLELGPALPPRKAWLTVDMAHLGQLVNLLSSDLAAGGFSGAAQSSGQQMNSIVSDVQAHYKKLQTLTAGPKYDNIAIGKEALGIYDDMSKLEKPWKSAVSSIKKG